MFIIKTVYIVVVVITLSIQQLAHSRRLSADMIEDGDCN